MILITVHLPKRDIELLDRLAKERFFSSRSEIIRYAIKTFILNFAEKYPIKQDDVKRHMVVGIR